MATAFIIQASNPRAELIHDIEDESLSDAVQAVFPMETEDMLMVWNGIYVPLSYKYDVSLMVDDILDLCGNLLAATEGHRVIWWPSNTFAAVWDVKWCSNVVTIKAQWHRVVGGTEALLAAKPCISIPVDDFLAEWKRPLELVADALRGAGYTQEQISRVSDIDEAVVKLPMHGQLYRCFATSLR
jgi:hypothetical protein